MTRLLLIRHGQTDWNVEGRWQGLADVPLNARGRAQAEQLAQSLDGAPIDAIYSSDLERARATAGPLAGAHGLAVQLDPRLREIDQGEWQGLLFDEIESRYAEVSQKRRENPLEVAPPGGETALQVRERVLAAVQDILAAHPGQTVAIVSHGFSLALILVHFLGEPFEQVWDLIPENGTVTALEIS